MSAFLNDRFIENENALLHISDLSMQRGYAIFDFFRTVNGRPLFLDDHLDRFYSSAKAMRLQVAKSREELKFILYELIRQSSIAEAGVRIMLTGGYAADGYTPATPNLLITCKPMHVVTPVDFKKGISIITYEHQRELPQIKSINYLTAVWLQPLIKEKQADDVLYYNQDSITEFPRSNIFIVTKDDVLVTPANKILKGITRKHTLTLAAAIMKTEERDITPAELMQAKEVMVSSTSRKIMPVLKINGAPVSNGRPAVVTCMLYEKFLELEKKSVTEQTSA